MTDTSDLYDWSDASLSVRPAPLQVALAWLLLATTGLVLAFGGFASVGRFVTAWPFRRRRGPIDRERVSIEMSAALRGACAYYISRTWCLQKSATLACLLKSHGVRGEVVIGVSKAPFRAHAWVEADRIVVNGPPTLGARMLVIERWS